MVVIDTQGNIYDAANYYVSFDKGCELVEQYFATCRKLHCPPNIFICYHLDHNYELVAFLPGLPGPEIDYVYLEEDDAYRLASKYYIALDADTFGGQTTYQAHD